MLNTFCSNKNKYKYKQKEKNKIDTHKISFYYYINTFTIRYVSCLGKGDWGKTTSSSEEYGCDVG